MQKKYASRCCILCVSLEKDEKSPLLNLCIKSIQKEILSLFLRILHSFHLSYYENFASDFAMMLF